MMFQVHAGVFSTEIPVKSNRVVCRACGTWLVELDATATVVVANNGPMHFYAASVPEVLPKAQPIDTHAIVQCKKCKEQWHIMKGARQAHELLEGHPREIFRDPKRPPRKSGWSIGFYPDEK